MTAPITHPDLRVQILDAALRVLQADGLKVFSQTRVAEAVGIRQSHLTYYFPTRADLLEAVATRLLDGVTASITAAGPTVPNWGAGPLLSAMARRMVATDHMRMFLAMIVEADRDPVIHALMTKGAARVRDTFAAVLGGPDADQRARVIQTALWGLGLYTFALRPTPDADPTDGILDLLEAFAQ